MKHYTECDYCGKDVDINEVYYINVYTKSENHDIGDMDFCKECFENVKNNNYQDEKHIYKPTTICYMEDWNGGILCYSDDKEYFLNQRTNPSLCIEGTKEEVEEYIHGKINREQIWSMYIETKNGKELRKL